MSGEFAAFLIVSIIGYFIGGGAGLYLGHGWNPDCWYGLITAMVLAVGGCACALGDFDW